MQGKYELLHRNKFLTLEAKSITEMAEILASTADWMHELVATGKVILGDEDGVGDDYAYFYTDDPEVAAKYGFRDVSELYPEEFDDDEDCDDPLEAPAGG